jgi:hypothetical protein
MQARPILSAQSCKVGSCQKLKLQTILETGIVTKSCFLFCSAFSAKLSSKLPAFEVMADAHPQKGTGGAANAGILDHLLSCEGIHVRALTLNSWKGSATVHDCTTQYIANHRPAAAWRPLRSTHERCRAQLASCACPASCGGQARIR